MVIEFARNVCGLEHANSTEFDPATPDRVIYKLRELKGVDELGGTMRLGAYPCLLAEGSFARQAYGAAGDQRAPSPSLRIQSRIRARSDVATACASPARRRIGVTWKSARSRIIPGSWAASSIPSSNPSRWSRIRCSPPSDRRVDTTHRKSRRQVRSARPVLARAMIDTRRLRYG